MPRLTISLLGPLHITLDGEPITDFATDKVRALLAYLVVEAARPHRRDALAGLLWPDQPQRKARQNLRQALSLLRQAIGDQNDDDGVLEPFILVSRETVQFNPVCDYRLDVEAFTSLITSSHSHRHRRWASCRSCIMRLREAVEIYRGGFLEQFYLSDSSLFEEWATLKREWLRRQAVDALSHLADYYERRGDYGQARRYAWRQVELELWREEAHRQLMRLLALDGQRSVALAQYETCRRALAEELGVEPTGETVALYEKIRAGENLSPVSLLHRLPLSPTPFVGRDDELEELAELLGDPDCRLLTLVGPGGIGKTRLALQAAREQIGSFAHGVYFAPLDSVSSAEFMVPAIAEVLNFSFQGRQDSETQLLNYLREKEMLLVLDNLEHLLEEAGLLAEVLQCAPGVVLLVTSRERLSLQEEWVYAVEGLSYPHDGDTGAEEALVSVEGCSAVELFVQSALRANRHFALSETEASCVVRICRLVEGMPLALELAAAGVAMYSCREIAQQINRNLGVLTTSLRNVPERHRSMQAAFEHSWSLLTEHEHQVFARLSVFQGGFERDAAEKVAGASLVVLTALVYKSLLRFDISGRFQIHQLLRQYADEKLQQVPQQKEAVHQQHAHYYAAFLEQREGALKGRGQRDALEEIGLEVDNVRRAWHWVVTQIEKGRNEVQAIALIQKLAKTLYLFYTTRDWYQEGKEAFGQAVAALENDMPSGEKELLLGILLAYQGKCCEFTEHSDQAQQLYEKSLAILQRLGAWQETVLPLHGLGYMAHIKGEYARAEQYFERSMEVYQGVQDRWGIANVLNNMSLVARRQGAFSRAKRHVEESLAIRREIGDQRGVASSLSNLGLIYCDLGEYAEAGEVLQEAVRICRQLDYRVGLANSLTGLCQAAFRLGEVQQAQQCGQESLAVYRDIGDYWGVAIAYNNLGRMAAELKDYARAKLLYQESIAVYRQIGIKSGLANTLGNLGEASFHLSEYTHARQYLCEALQIAYGIGAIPAALKNLVWLAPLLARNGETVTSLELLAFAMHQPTIAQDIKQQAAGLFSELAADRSLEEVAAAEAKGQVYELDAVMAKVHCN